MEKNQKGINWPALTVAGVLLASGVAGRIADFFTKGEVLLGVKTAYATEARSDSIMPDDEPTVNRTPSNNNRPNSNKSDDSKQANDALANYVYEPTYIDGVIEMCPLFSTDVMASLMNGEIPELYKNTIIKPDDEYESYIDKVRNMYFDINRIEDPDSEFDYIQFLAVPIVDENSFSIRIDTLKDKRKFYYNELTGEPITQLDAGWYVYNFIRNNGFFDLSPTTDLLIAADEYFNNPDIVNMLGLLAGTPVDYTRPNGTLVPTGYGEPVVSDAPEKPDTDPDPEFVKTP